MLFRKGQFPRVIYILCYILISNIYPCGFYITTGLYIYIYILVLAGKSRSLRHVLLKIMPIFALIKRLFNFFKLKQTDNKIIVPIIILFYSLALAEITAYFVSNLLMIHERSKRRLTQI